MASSAYEQIQARKVKARLRMLQHAQRVSGNVSQTCRFFGVSRALFYIWKKRYEKSGLAGLRDQSRRPHRIRFRPPPKIVSLILRIREERRYGAIRTSLYLQRHYHAYVSPTDSEEFYRGRSFKNKKDLCRKIKRWETQYNEHRPHLALKGQTPAERVRELVQQPSSAKDPS